MHRVRAERATRAGRRRGRVNVCVCRVRGQRLVAHVARTRFLEDGEGRLSSSRCTYPAQGFDTRNSRDKFAASRSPKRLSPKLNRESLTSEPGQRARAGCMPQGG